MSTSKPELGPRIAGAGGAVLIASLFLPWSEVGGRNRNGWETMYGTDVFLLIVGVFAIWPRSPAAASACSAPTCP